MDESEFGICRGILHNPNKLEHFATKAQRHKA